MTEINQFELGNLNHSLALYLCLLNLKKMLMKMMSTIYLKLPSNCGEIPLYSIKVA